MALFGIEFNIRQRHGFYVHLWSCDDYSNFHMNGLQQEYAMGLKPCNP